MMALPLRLASFMPVATDRIASSEEALSILPTIVRLPIHLDLELEEMTDDEGQNYTLSWPRLRIVGSGETITFYSQPGDPAGALAELAHQPHAVEMLLRVLQDLPETVRDQPAILITQVPPLAFLRAMDRLIECSWMGMLDGEDNMDAPADPGVAVHPARPLTPSMASPILQAP